MPVLPIMTYALEAVSLTRGQYDELSVCWNNLFWRIFDMYKWESVQLIQYYCGSLDFTRLCNLHRLRFLQRKFFAVLLLKSCSMSIMLISVCCCLQLTVLYIEYLLVYVVCDVLVILLVYMFWYGFQLAFILSVYVFTFLYTPIFMVNKHMYNGCSSSSKVVDFNINQNNIICNFLTMINSNLGPILPHFTDIAGFCRNQPHHPFACEIWGRSPCGSEQWRL